MKIHEIPNNESMNTAHKTPVACVHRELSRIRTLNLGDMGRVFCAASRRAFVHSTTGSAGMPRPAQEPDRCSLSRSRAFTLLELMLVITIMGMLATLMVPAVKGMRKMNDMTVACRQLQDDLGLARQRAISERTTVYVVFVPPSIADANVMAALRADPDRRSIAMYTNLAKGQYTSYALYTDRRLGDQPGQRRPRYLTEWKILPEGVFIATNKFMDWSQNARLFSQTPALHRPFRIHPAGSSLNPKQFFRFPHENSVYTNALPYIAFNSRGQIQHPDRYPEWVPRDRDEVIPLARGSIFYLKSADGRFLPADVKEVPPGNSTNTFNRIRINWLTGRARVERPEIQ